VTLAIALDNRHTPPVLSLHGDIDLNTAPKLVEEAGRLIDDGSQVLVLDLSGVGFCDSSGLSALVRLRNRVQPLGGRVILAGPTPIVQRVLEVSGLTEIFGTFPTVEAALAADG
jgi:anti-sigma B factor antagonist